MFMLRFRAEAARIEHEQPALPQPVVPAKQAALRILIVDDNATNRLLLAQQLRYAGHHVLVADGGAAALALWLRLPFLLVVLLGALASAGVRWWG